MKNLKKFFAFSIATAMVAGAVWAGTPGFMALADTSNTCYWDKSTNQYTQTYQETYTEVYNHGSGRYTEIDQNVESVSIDKDSVILAVGATNPSKATVQLNATVTPIKDRTCDQTVSWSSSDTSVAMVDESGVVTSGDAGTATITATSNGNPNITATTVVEVVAPITEMTITLPDKLYLDEGHLSTLDAVSITPTNGHFDDKIKFTSSNSDVISITDDYAPTYDYINAHTTGTATITATAHSSVFGDYKPVTKTVTVVRRASRIEIEAESKGLYVGETGQLRIKAYPDYAEVPEVTWKSSNPSVLDVTNNGTITAKSSGFNSGSVKITATPKDSKVSPTDIYIYVTKEGIEVSPTEATIYVGGYTYIDAISEWNPHKPESDSITWSIDGSDKVFATQSNRWLFVEGLKPGTAKITATIGSGDKAKSATSIITISSEASKQNATDPNAPTSEEQAKQEQTPESIANYQTWLATYGGGTTAAAGTTAVSGTVGQPGSEVIVDTGAGEPVAMFQSNDATNTLLAAPVGVVPSGTKIETVEAGKDSAVFKAAQNKLATISRRGTVQKVYGIAGLNSDGSLLTTINGKAAMSMPLPSDVSVPAGKSLKVYLIDDNGQTTKLDTAIDQGRVVFEIPKFGTFAFVVE